MPAQPLTVSPQPPTDPPTVPPRLPQAHPALHICVVSPRLSQSRPALHIGAVSPRPSQTVAFYADDPVAGNYPGLTSGAASASRWMDES